MKLFAPLINDISTDLDEPPQFADSEARPLPGKVTAAIRKHYADLGPLHLSVDEDAAFRLVLEAAERMARWKLSVIDREARILEGFAVTSLLRFRDDFVVRVRADGNSSRVDMRSRSRAGKGDFGANAARIGSFFDQVRALA